MGPKVQFRDIVCICEMLWPVARLKHKIRTVLLNILLHEQGFFGLEKYRGGALEFCLNAATVYLLVGG